MSTRFYLPNTGAAAVSPAFDAAWDRTGQADRRAMVRTKISSAMFAKSIGDEAVANQKYLWRQFVSEPIVGQTISGTVSGQIRTSQGEAATKHDRVTIGIRVVSNDGLTVRGTLLSVAFYGTTNLYSSTATRTNRAMAIDDALTSVVAENDDRIVVEIGTQPSTVPESFEDSVDAVFGDDAVSDLPVDETTTTPENAWIEFSQELVAPPGIERTQNLEDVRLTQTLGPANISASQILQDARLEHSLSDIRLTQTIRRDHSTTQTIEGGT